MPHGAPPIAFDDTSHLHSLAERIHRAANELPLAAATYSRSNNLDALDDSTREIAGLLTHLTTAAAGAAQTVHQNHGVEPEITRHKVTLLTHTVGAIGRALADLGEAVAQAGLLHHLSAQPRSTERGRSIASARSLLHRRINSTRRQLNEAGRRLHQEADRLAAPSAPPRATGAPVTAPSIRPALPPPAAPADPSVRASGAPVRTHHR